MARSLEQIWNDAGSVGALRSECSDLGIKRVIRDGFEIPTSRGRVDGKDANAENYLADIVISDMEKIQDIWNWKPDLSMAELETIRHNPSTRN